MSDSDQKPDPYIIEHQSKWVSRLSSTALVTSGAVIAAGLVFASAWGLSNISQSTAQDLAGQKQISQAKHDGGPSHKGHLPKQEPSKPSGQQPSFTSTEPTSQPTTEPSPLPSWQGENGHDDGPGDDGQDDDGQEHHVEHEGNGDQGDNDQGDD
jgi:hypothetical protein